MNDNSTVMLFKKLFRICLLKESPSELPNSLSALLLFIAIAVAFTAMGYGQVPTISVAKAWIAALVLNAILIALIYFVLRAKSFGSRLIKTLLGFYGTQVILKVLQSLLFWILPKEVMLAWVMVFEIWGIVISAFILSKALEVKMFKAVLFILGIMILSSLPVYGIIGEELQEHIDRMREAQTGETNARSHIGDKRNLHGRIGVAFFGNRVSGDGTRSQYLPTYEHAIATTWY